MEQDEAEEERFESSESKSNIKERIKNANRYKYMFKRKYNADSFKIYQTILEKFV